jgi:hypothetical protein
MSNSEQLSKDFDQHKTKNKKLKGVLALFSLIVVVVCVVGKWQTKFISTTTKEEEVKETKEEEVKETKEEEVKETKEEEVKETKEEEVNLPQNQRGPMVFRPRSSPELGEIMKNHQTEQNKISIKETSSGTEGEKTPEEKDFAEKFDEIFKKAYKETWKTRKILAPYFVSLFDKKWKKIGKGNRENYERERVVYKDLLKDKNEEEWESIIKEKLEKEFEESLFKTVRTHFESSEKIKALWDGTEKYVDEFSKLEDWKKYFEERVYSPADDDEYPYG